MRLLFCILLLSGQVCISQSIESYLSPPFPTNLVSSMDGKSIAWVFNDKGSRNVYMATMPDFKARKITNYTGDDGIEIPQFLFNPDGKQILFVRGNTPNNQGENANPAFLQTSTERIIYAIDIKTLSLRKISAGTNPVPSHSGKNLAFLIKGQVWIISLTDTTSKPKQLFQSRGSQFQLRWSPDDSKLAYVSARGDHSFVGIYDFNTKSADYTESSLDQDAHPVWSPDGSQLAYIRIPNIHNQLPFVPVRSSNPWSIRVYDVKTQASREIWKADPGPGSVFLDDIPVADNLLWWASANKLVFPYEKEGWQQLYSLDLMNQKLSLLTPGKGEVENVTLANDGKSIYYTTNINDIDRRHIWKHSLSAGTNELITPGTNIEFSPVVIENGIAFLTSSATTPAWPAVKQHTEIKKIATELFPADFPKTLVQPMATMVTATDGMEVPAQVFMPSNHKQGEKHPAIIFLHGGSRRQMLLGFNYSQYYSNAYAMNQYFASQGYVVLSLNYRSGIGYGLEFREALNYGADGASEVRDLIGAGMYLKSRPDVDGSKIALWGGSYGGYLTAHGLSQAPDLFATGVDIHGVHNWNDEIPTFAPWYDYAKYPELAKKAYESSPVYHIKNWKNPVLLIHGEDDRNVPISESVNIIEPLRKQGVHVEQLVFPDEVHGFLLHKNWLKTYKATFEFTDRILKGKKS